MAEKRKFLLPLALVGLLIVGGAPVLARLAGQLNNAPKSLVDEVWQTVDREYVDGSFNKQDWQAVRRQLLARNYESDEDAYKAIRKALALLNDPYTRFLAPKEFAELKEETKGELVGVGIALGLSKKEKLPLVVKTFKGSPAEGAGVQSLDLITAVDDQTTTGVALETISRRIRGKSGTPVKLTLRRSAKKMVSLTITRRSITIPVVESSLRTFGKHKFGYLQLQEFSEQAAPQMQLAIDTLSAQGAKGWILDMRGNPGGLVEAAVEIANLFLEDGTIVSVVDRQGLRETLRADGRPHTKLPVIILVDGGTASAGEILAGALQDNRRATLVGATTFGKGIIQQVNTLSNGAGVNVTIAHYLTPSGKDIHKKGIVPDVKALIPPALLKTLKANQVATAADPQYARGLEVLKSKLELGKI
ncbi:MAG: PDZ domain-containing protein [Anaerolineae bacterium]|nr:PDZ domain-containing protein [Gloeobacterales cyanobacterium ES-bin-313]